MNTPHTYPMIAKTMAELEDEFAEELIGIGAENVNRHPHGVFTGDKALMYKAKYIAAPLQNIETHPYLQSRKCR